MDLFKREKRMFQFAYFSCQVLHRNVGPERATKIAGAEIGRIYYGKMCNSFFGSRFHMSICTFNFPIFALQKLAPECAKIGIVKI